MAAALRSEFALRTSFSFDLFGAAIRIRANSPELLARARLLIPTGWQPLDGRARITYSLDTDYRETGHGLCTVRRGSRVVAIEPLEKALRCFESDLHTRIATNTRGYTFVHAGVVGYRGLAIVIPGKSGSGKSTLVAALLRAGCSYYSDEFAVLDPQGRVHPFPRDLSLRDGYVPAGRYEASAFGSSIGRVPLRIGSIVVTWFEAGGRTLMDTVSSGKGALALIANALFVSGHSAEGVSAICRGASGSAVFKGPRGDATATAHLIVQSLDGEGQGAPSPESVIEEERDESEEHIC